MGKVHKNGPGINGQGQVQGGPARHGGRLVRTSNKCIGQWYWSMVCSWRRRVAFHPSLTRHMRYSSPAAVPQD